MRKIKEILFSENGMKAVNTLFFLAMFFYSSGLLFVAYIVWICYLVFCIRISPKAGKVNHILCQISGHLVFDTSSLFFPVLACPMA